MKRILTILLFLLFITILSGCAVKETPGRIVTFNIEEGTEFEQYTGETSIDISSVTATDFDGIDITPFIEIKGEYDLDTPGTYNLSLHVTDNLGAKGSIAIVLIILEETCEMNSEQDKCKVPVTGISINVDPQEIVTIMVDDFIILNWTINPLDATNQDVEVSSSDETIATVTNLGHIFAKEPGFVTITVTTLDGNFMASVDIEVLAKSCIEDPYQDKCADEIIGDMSRITNLTEGNLSGTNYNEIYFNNQIFYEIYVRTFADSDGNNKGDFTGIKETLPYLESLNVGGIWLMPITDSRSDHGYEVDDYFDVDSEYGTMQDFRDLVAAANEKDIDIIIDLVVNHMGAFNPKFQDVLRNGTESMYFDWFTWASAGDPRITIKNSWGQTMWYNPSTRNWLKDGNFETHASLENMYYVGYFSDWMPDLNLANPEVVAYVESIVDFWILDVGVKGFRMDATSHFFGYNENADIVDREQANTDFLTEFNNYVLSLNPEAYVVAEAWEGYHTYAKLGESKVSMFNFQASYDIKSMVNGYVSDLASGLKNVYDTLANYNPNFIDAVFFNNHDTERLAYGTSDLNKLRMAAEILLTLPGNPYIYYGDEIGMRGQRTNMVWGSYYDGLYVNYEDRNILTVSESLLDDDSLLQTYIELGETRVASLALQYGEFIPLDDSDFQGYYRVFENGEDKELVVVLFNTSSFRHKPIPTEFTSYEILYKTYDNNFGGVSPKGTMILQLPFELLDDVTN